MGNIYGAKGGNYAGTVYDDNGLSPCLSTMQGGNLRQRRTAAGLHRGCGGGDPGRANPRDSGAGTVQNAGAGGAPGRSADPLALYPPHRTGYCAGGSRSRRLPRPPPQTGAETVTFSPQEDQIRLYANCIKNYLKNFAFF